MELQTAIENRDFEAAERYLQSLKTHQDFGLQIRWKNIEKTVMDYALEWGKECNNQAPPNRGAIAVKLLVDAGAVRKPRDADPNIKFFTPMPKRSNMRPTKPLSLAIQKSRNRNFY